MARKERFSGCQLCHIEGRILWNWISHLLKEALSHFLVEEYFVQKDGVQVYLGQINRHHHAVAANLVIAVKPGQWEKASHRGRELTGKNIGLIGFGAIAREFAALLAPFGVKLMVQTRTVPEAGEFAHIEFTSDLRTLLETSDIVSLHCPLSDGTCKILGPEEFGLLPPGAIIINTARGELLDETALLQALGSGQVAAAGLDCFAVEPPAPLSQLIAHPRVVATPHIGWATHEAARNMGLVTAQNIVSYLSGIGPPRAHIVNFEALE